MGRVRRVSLSSHRSWSTSVIRVDSRVQLKPQQNLAGAIAVRLVSGDLVIAAVLEDSGSGRVEKAAMPRATVKPTASLRSTGVTSSSANAAAAGRRWWWR